MEVALNKLSKSEALKGWWYSDLFEDSNEEKIRLWEYRSPNSDDLILQFRDVGDLAISDVIVIPKRFMPFIGQRLHMCNSASEFTDLFGDLRVREEQPQSLVTDKQFQEDSEIVLSNLGTDLLKEFGLENSRDIVKYQTLYCIACKLQYKIRNIYSLEDILSVFINHLPTEYLQLSEEDSIVTIQLNLAIEEFFLTKIGRSLPTRDWLGEIEVLLWKTEYNKQSHENKLDVLHLTSLGNRLIDSLYICEIEDIKKCRIIFTAAQLAATSGKCAGSYNEIIKVFIKSMPDIYLRMPGAHRLVGDPLFTTIKNLLSAPHRINDINHAISENHLQDSNISELGQQTVSPSKRVPYSQRIGDISNSLVLNKLGERIITELHLTHAPAFMKIGALLLVSGEVKKLLGFKYTIAQIVVVFTDSFPNAYRVPYDIDSGFIGDHIDKLQQYSPNFNYDLIKHIANIWQYDILDTLKNRRP